MGFIDMSQSTRELPSEPGGIYGNNVICCAAASVVINLNLVGTIWSTLFPEYVLWTKTICIVSVQFTTCSRGLFGTIIDPEARWIGIINSINRLKETDSNILREANGYEAAYQRIRPRP